ncbi:MAG: hypothetical protein CVV64_05665 [Candidatus Wallbacteria bacterium HGW-Wallbacteria-1]|jgi:hypothetical protein|uniref:Uncharacterized protein n=1 Tax=Candidatus Wallbacteria bacterium HGW-Wallbacteria-1 TaxID=2013854 RepID=A0A2N1PSE3_9BACT|nr:MAG: hypothetical protein CVV64_05665 [Candidatus Wallbacteria bacterium HGW-Wallbacteria-1]
MTGNWQTLKNLNSSSRDSRRKQRAMRIVALRNILIPIIMACTMLHGAFLFYRFNHPVAAASSEISKKQNKTTEGNADSNPILKTLENMAGKIPSGCRLKKISRNRDNDIAIELITLQSKREQIPSLLRKMNFSDISFHDSAETFIIKAVMTQNFLKSHQNERPKNHGVQK